MRPSARFPTLLWFGAALFGATLGLMLATNPSQPEYEAWLDNRAQTILRTEIPEDLPLTRALLPFYAHATTSRENFLAWSVYATGAARTLGILGHFYPLTAPTPPGAASASSGPPPPPRE